MCDPLVSVGFPVYNESKYITESLMCILGQDYNNIEIIVSDNCSTDDTYSICENLLRSNKNVVLHRQNRNRGAAENFNFVLEQSQGKYFMWASGHDLWDANLISQCVRLLESEPGAVVAFGNSIWVDGDGGVLEKSSGYTDTRGMGRIERFMTVFWGNMHPILGVIRKSALEKVTPVSQAVGADLILLSRLALLGHFVHAPLAGWRRREFRHEQSHDKKVKRYCSAEYGLTKSWVDRVFPLGRLPLELCRGVFRSELSRMEKLLLCMGMLFCLPLRYWAGKRKA